MKLISKITLSLLLIFSLTLTASALTIYTNSYHTNSIEADQKGKGSDQGRDSNRDNSGSRAPEKQPRGDNPPKNDPPRRDNEKQPLVIKRGEKDEKRKGGRD